MELTHNEKQTYEDQERSPTQNRHINNQGSRWIWKDNQDIGGNFREEVDRSEEGRGGA